MSPVGVVAGGKGSGCVALVTFAVGDAECLTKSTAAPAMTRTAMRMTTRFNAVSNATASDETLVHEEDHMPTLEDAIALAVEAHRGQTDKIGQPYVLHVLRVMFRCETEIERIVAVLHDVVEDTG